MNQRMLINVTRGGNAQPEEIRLALTEKSKLIDLDIEDPKKRQKVSNIYKGRISSIEPSLGAVFVNYGSEKHGFLPLKEVSSEYFHVPFKNGDKQASINDLLKVGDFIVVQIDKEERDAKGAALTTFISLAGSFLVLMPNNPRAGGISRRISGEERDDLREIVEKLSVPEGMGFIIRTAGLGKTLEELEWDLQVQLNFWELIKQAAVEKNESYLIHQESNVIKRAVRDYLRKEIVEIIIDDAETFETIQDYISHLRPDCKDLVKLYDNTLPLFSHFNIEQQIEAAFRRDVRLPSGGSMVIDHTEALISVDINSARATRGGNIEETAYQTNLEAAQEIARQLRIRDIGGLIVIDFIDMLSNNHQRDVENRLRNSMRNDRARIQIGRISRFGLLEMSRQRIRTPLKSAHQITCDHCLGRGTVRTVESVALALVRLIEEQAVKAGSAQIHIQASVDLATYLLNEKRLMLRNIQEATGKSITVIPNQHLESPNYTLKLVKEDHSKHIPSYKQAKVPKVENSKKGQKTSFSQDSEPAINQFLKTGKSVTPPRKTNQDGLIKRLWETIFGSPEPTPVSPTPKPRKNTSASNKRKAAPKGRSRPQAKSDSQDERNKPKRKKPLPKTSKREASETNESDTDSNRRNQRSRRPTSQNEKSKQPNQNKPRQKSKSEADQNENAPKKGQAPTQKSSPKSAEKVEHSPSESKAAPRRQPKKSSPAPKQDSKPTQTKAAEGKNSTAKSKEKPANEKQSAPSKGGVKKAPAKSKENSSSTDKNQTQSTAPKTPVPSTSKAKESGTAAVEIKKTPADYFPEMKDQNKGNNKGGDKQDIKKTPEDYFPKTNAPAATETKSKEKIDTVEKKSNSAPKEIKKSPADYFSDNQEAKLQQVKTKKKGPKDHSEQASGS